MVPIELLERTSGMENKVSRGFRMSVTELSRGTDWRKRLPEEGIIEVTDRGDTAAWLISDDDMQALMQSYALLKDELERTQIDAIFETRDQGRPIAGDALKKSVRSTFLKRKTELAEVIDGRQ